MTYRVPVTQKVNDDVNLSRFDVPPKTAQATVAPATAGAAHSAPNQRNAAEGPVQAPLFRPALRSPDADHLAANTTAPTASSGATSSNISQDAEIALGHAEIIVRDAQSRFETALAALNRARNAAHSGDSALVIKFSRTAMALARPGP